MICLITFIYCQHCDTGIMIECHRHYVPHDYAQNNYHMVQSMRCEYGDWYNVGVIKCEDVRIKVVERLRINYDRFC